MKKYVIICLNFLIFSSGFAKIKVINLYENINFPQTDKVRILVEEPREPHLVFAKIEKRGDTKTSTLKILSEMEDYGKQMGADAFVLERKVKRFPDGSFLIKSNVIKFTSSIKTLVENGYVLNYTPVGLKGGLESDVVPLALNGMRISIWAGKARWTGRLSYYFMHIPDNFWKDGFDDPNISSGIEISASYFIKSGFRGWYGSTGFGQIKGEVGHTAETVKGKFTKSYVLLGIGYKYYLLPFLYMNGKAAGQFNFGGDKAFSVGNQLAEVTAVSPQLSVSFGYEFVF